ncbi:MULTISPECIES: hypothetical protein [unclassified Paenibacillus]|uniref:hypothetical protein n=1 Tax=unclassified Paenibacillus TaxID=185978 RepID=UPI001C121C62|nr:MULTISPECIES: hypothetical protein [unclassified Paenibacillus]MBU5445318.1 hypothetical protein [Paenibacillus sp. MSJ-34]CAH0118542.1 hypothetical protein PAE9249_01031 [Paenibacillus sp. CECT 9249]
MAILFWPCMIASVVLSLIGIVFLRHQFLYVSAALIVPMSLYLAATPLFMGWGLVFPLCYIGSALALRNNRPRLSLLASVPVYGVIGWLAFTVLSQG